MMDAGDAGSGGVGGDGAGLVGSGQVNHFRIRDYVMSLPGMVRCGLVIMDFLAWVCLMSNSNFLGTGKANYYLFVTIVAMFTDGILLILILSQICERIPHFTLVQMGEAAVFAFLYFVGMIVVWAAGNGAAWAFAGIFGLGCQVLFGIDIFLNYKVWKGAGGTFTDPLGAAPQVSTISGSGTATVDMTPHITGMANDSPDVAVSYSKEADQANEAIGKLGGVGGETNPAASTNPTSELGGGGGDDEMRY